MNDYVDRSELPELVDFDVNLLYRICKRASHSSDPPFKSLFAAYDAEFAQEQIQQEHDGAVFRWIMRVGESTAADNRAKRPVDLLGRLRELLEEKGVTIVDDEDDAVEHDPDATGTIHERQQQFRPSRRVSFDDARYEETWLSEHSQDASLQPPPARRDEARMPLRDGISAVPGRRTRSASSPRSYTEKRSSAARHRGSPPPRFSTETEDEDGREDREDRVDQGIGDGPDLFFEPSQTQLEQNAEAFLSTSSIRAARQALHVWHDMALRHQQTRAQAYSIAANHDRRTLLKQALDQWRMSFEAKQEDQRIAERYDRLEDRARRARDLFLLTKSFTHWATSCEHEKLKTTVAQHHILKVTYFRRWKAIAHENQTKIRSILARKYLAVWREKTSRRQLWHEQAVAVYEERLMRRCKDAWFWKFCSQRVESWHDMWTKKRIFLRVVNCSRELAEKEKQARSCWSSQAERNTLHLLSTRLRQRQQKVVQAQRHDERSLTSRTLHTLHVQARLGPSLQTMSLKVNLALERKAFETWQLNLRLSRQAIEVNRKRILQSTWTKWNDALRCRALAQKMDERVLIDSLYRWALQERLKLFERTMSSRLIGQVLVVWRTKLHGGRDRLDNAAMAFAETQRRRQLASSMLRLNLAMRNREDAERAAVEVANMRVLPKVIEVWKRKTDHARRLAKWAADARYYCLSTNTLKLWGEKTTEHKHNRRRDAYAHVRSKIKIRLVRQSFTRWRSQRAGIEEMNQTAERLALDRHSAIAAQTLAHWHTRSLHYTDLSIQAAALDNIKLITSALSALTIRYDDLLDADQQALAFTQETSLALQAGVFRRLQWSTFTHARNVESADALWARNRDAHIKQMLRHWASQTASKRSSAAKSEDAGEPDSPSLRPASRAASRSRSAERSRSPPATPGYMRTPSRSGRRSGRFRALPTPVGVTPMAFDSAYLATTPAPVSATPLTQRREARGQHGMAVGGEGNAATESLTPQVTPFSRKLRAGGFTPVPPSALRRSVFGKSTGGGTAKSVRFAGNGGGKFRRSPS